MRLTLKLKLVRDCFYFTGIVTQFILSKPPGRRLVTADIHNIFVISFHFLNVFYVLLLLARVIFGHLPFWIIFVIVELMKQSLFMTVSIFNISALIQASFILNLSWVHIYDDKAWKTIYL